MGEAHQCILRFVSSILLQGRCTRERWEPSPSDAFNVSRASISFQLCNIEVDIGSTLSQINQTRREVKLASKAEGLSPGELM
jgi:hypothetical protein